MGVDTCCFSYGGYGGQLNSNSSWPPRIRSYLACSTGRRGYFPSRWSLPDGVDSYTGYLMGFIRSVQSPLRLGHWFLGGRFSDFFVFRKGTGSVVDLDLH